MCRRGTEVVEVGERVEDVVAGTLDGGKVELGDVVVERGELAVMHVDARDAGELGAEGGSCG